MEMAKCGMPCRKFVVPSIGSIIQTGASSSPATCPPSSMIKPHPGRAFSSSSRKIRSAVMSACDTKSAAPLRLTCKFSTSPKSRIIRLDAASDALFITEMSAEREAICCYLVLCPFNIAGIFCLHHNPRAGFNMRRHHNPHAIISHCRFVG